MNWIPLIDHKTNLLGLSQFQTPESKKTSINLHILLTHLLISPILRTSARTLLCYIPLSTENRTLRCPILVLFLHHHTSAIITDCNRSTTLFPRLDLPGFWPGTERKREVWLLRTGFGIAPVNKLVSLTWLSWALRSFRCFTLHYPIETFFQYHLISSASTEKPSYFSAKTLTKVGSASDLIGAI